jgi:spore germination cell wall hydrolase CwlJ-like protein
MALNLYHECRNCDLLEQLAVYNVVLSRVKDPRYPDNTCDVVYQTEPVVQFSWYKDGLEDVPKELKTWADIQEKVKLFKRSSVPDPTNGALCYHRKDVKGWRCGNSSREFQHHVFYHDR